MSYYNKIKNAAKAIEDNCGKADIAIILGSGLGDYASQLENANSISYSSIPGFPDSTVPGHAGVWHCGTLENKQVYMMQGRFHAYEGYDLQDVTLPIRVMKQLGVKTLIVTNAAGGVNLAFKPGELMLITDCINLSGKNPLIGPNLDEFGPRFPDMSEAFSKNYRNIAEKVAVTNGIKLHKGVYAWLNGPCFETPAEIRMCRALGIDAVGMSTVPEVIVANHSGIKVIGISCITNMAAGILAQPLNHEEVMETGKRAQFDFRKLINAIVKEI